MTTPVEMTSDELRAIDDEGLCRRCVEPAIAQVRGQPMELRLRLYDTLGAGQRALLGFWVLYAHGSDGWTGVRAQLPHLVGHEAFWSTLEDSARHLGMADLLESIARAKPSFDASADTGRLAEVDASLLAWRPNGLAVAASYVRGHLGEFVRIRS
jgi:hypothetical protein